MSQNIQLTQEAEALKRMAYALGDTLYEKCLAYGSAHNRQVDIWAAVLKQYETEIDGEAVYVIPDALIYHMPRLTRVFDRIMRIVSNPTADAMGEDPWRDLAGDALAGAVMPKPRSVVREVMEEILNGQFITCPAPRCERALGHDGMHARMDASGVSRWHEDPAIAALGSTPAPELVAHPRGYDPVLDG